MLHFRRQKSVSLKVWATVASDLCKSFLMFIDTGVKFSNEDFVKTLEENALSWFTENLGERYIFT